MNLAGGFHISTLLKGQYSDFTSRCCWIPFALNNKDIYLVFGCGYCIFPNLFGLKCQSEGFLRLPDHYFAVCSPYCKRDTVNTILNTWSEIDVGIY